MPPNITAWLAQLPDIATTICLALLGALLLVWVLASEARTRRLERLLKAVRRRP